MDEKDKKPTTIPVSSFDEEPNDSDTQADSGALDNDTNAEVDEFATNIKKNTPDESELDSSSVSAVEVQPVEGADEVISDSAEASSPDVVAEPSSPDPVDWAARAETESAAPTALAIPPKKSRGLKPVIIALVVLVLAAAAAYAVYMFALPKDQASTPTGTNQKSTVPVAQAQDPVSQVDSIINDEITTESAANETQTANESQSVSDVNSETNSVSGAYDDSSF
jgi:hypothetical protein